MEVGFSTQGLLQAEHELNEGTLVSATSSSGCTLPLAKRIISALVQHRVKPTPWRGQLPPPRVSPPRTLGDALEVAWRSKSSPCRSGSRHSSTSALLAGATSSSDSGSRVISKLPSVVGFGNTDGVPRITLGNSKSNLEQSLGRDLVCIGPGKWYRPVKGLIDLFSRIPEYGTLIPAANRILAHLVLTPTSCVRSVLRQWLDAADIHLVPNRH